MARKLLLGVASVAFVTVAHAEPKQTDIANFPPVGTRIGTTHTMVVTAPEQFNSSPAFEVSNVLYLNRCSGGCMVTGGTINDARQHIATYITPGPHIVSEFQNDAGQIGAAADADWNAVVQCLREVYSPFNVEITETLPTGGGNYTEAIIAGHPADVGLPLTVGGVAPAHNGCEPNDNAMSFSFANYESGSGLERIYGICWTAAQESAHHYGLDHAFQYSDGTSACNDPMTYRRDCGGQKFFRNNAAQCGEDQVRPCYCGGSQNSHAKIKNVFGDGVSIVPPPTATIAFPTNGLTVQNGANVAAVAGSKRGVARVELWLNNFKWAESKGAAFGFNGQPNPSNYSLLFPPSVPNSVIDIQVKAYDDLGVMGMSPIVTVTKGAPCTTADTCLAGQKCEAGKCFWDPPTGQLGDACTYPQFCESNLCEGTAEQTICTLSCIVGVMDSCPATYECLPAGNSGICFPKDEGGCCSVGGGPVWLHGGLAALVLGFVMRRRRRR